MTTLIDTFTELRTHWHNLTPDKHSKPEDVRAARLALRIPTAVPPPAKNDLLVFEGPIRSLNWSRLGIGLGLIALSYGLTLKSKQLMKKVSWCSAGVILLIYNGYRLSRFKPNAQAQPIADFQQLIRRYLQQRTEDLQQVHRANKDVSQDLSDSFCAGNIEPEELTELRSAFDWEEEDPCDESTPSDTWPITDQSMAAQGRLTARTLELVKKKQLSWTEVREVFSETLTNNVAHLLDTQNLTRANLQSLCNRTVKPNVYNLITNKQLCPNDLNGLSTVQYTETVWQLIANKRISRDDLNKLLAGQLPDTVLDLIDTDKLDPDDLRALALPTYRFMETVRRKFNSEEISLELLRKIFGGWTDNLTRLLHPPKEKEREDLSPKSESTGSVEGTKQKKPPDPLSMLCALYRGKLTGKIIEAIQAARAAERDSKKLNLTQEDLNAVMPFPITDTWFNLLAPKPVEHREEEAESEGTSDISWISRDDWNALIGGDPTLKVLTYLKDGALSWNDVAPLLEGVRMKKSAQVPSFPKLLERIAGLRTSYNTWEVGCVNFDKVIPHLDPQLWPDQSPKIGDFSHFQELIGIAHIYEDARFAYQTEPKSEKRTRVWAMIHNWTWSEAAKLLLKPKTEAEPFL